jgi:hypothetical protein
LLGLKPGLACDVIIVAAEFMLGVARVEARSCVRSNSMPLPRSVMVLLDTAQVITPLKGNHELLPFHADDATHH